MDRAGALDWMLLAAMAWCLVVAMVRLFALYRRGVRVVPSDWDRTALQMVGDTVAVLCLLAWAYFVLSYALGRPPNWVPSTTNALLWTGVLPHALGAFCLVLAPTIYTLAVLQLGISWRLGIDRKRPGPLVTTGVYACCRHPIYVAVGLLFGGAFLVQGRAVLLVLALVMGAVLQVGAVREEHFLAGTYGDAYLDYCRRVGRWLPFGVRRARTPGG